MAAQYERHHLSAKYPDIQGQAWVDFLDNLKETGPGGRKVWLYEGKILDGWQFYRGCLELGLEPEFKEFKGKEAKAEAFVETQNYHRRHESAEAMRRRVCDRRDRIAKARAEGKPIRTIAAAENVSPATVVNDLEAAGVQGCTPEGADTETSTNPEQNNGTVFKAVCDNCKKKGKNDPRCPICQDMIIKAKARKGKTDTKAAEKKAEAALKAKAKKAKDGFKVTRKAADQAKTFFESYKAVDERNQRSVETVTRRAAELCEAVGRLWESEFGK